MNRNEIIKLTNSELIKKLEEHVVFVFDEPLSESEKESLAYSEPTNPNTLCFERSVWNPLDHTKEGMEQALKIAQKFKIETEMFTELDQLTLYVWQRRVCEIALEIAMANRMMNVQCTVSL